MYAGAIVKFLLASIFQLLSGFVPPVPILLDKGTDKQKNNFLKPLARGDKLGAYSLSEPQSGSDASNMKTYAEKNGDHYIINGTKNWVTSGQNSDFVIFFCLTNKEAGSKGISAFIIEKGTPGFSSGKKENKLGMRASETAELIFDECRIPKENIIGNEGDGFIQAMKLLDGGRISIAALSLGIAKGAYEASLKYSKDIFKKIKCPLCLFHTVSVYPSPENELNLLLIKKYKEKFNIPIGYSGHEPSVSPSIGAWFLGADYIERHITLDRSMWGTDQSASLSSVGMSFLCDTIK